MDRAVEKLSKPAYPGPEKESSLFPTSPPPASIPAPDPNPLNNSSTDAVKESYSSFTNQTSFGEAGAAPRPGQAGVPLAGVDNDPYYTLRHNASIGALILCPILALIPPRKVDPYTFMLATSATLAGNNLVRDYTGRGVWERIDRRTSGLLKKPDPIEPLSTPTRTAAAAKEGSGDAYARARTAGRSLEQPGRLGEETRASTLSTAADSAQGETSSWPEERRAREKVALEDGAGYWGLIKSQVWEVWNWDRRFDHSGEVVEEDEHLEEKEEKRWEELKERGLKGGKRE